MTGKDSDEDDNSAINIDSDSLMNDQHIDNSPSWNFDDDDEGDEGDESLKEESGAATIDPSETNARFLGRIYRGYPTYFCSLTSIFPAIDMSVCFGVLGGLQGLRTPTEKYVIVIS